MHAQLVEDVGPVEFDGARGDAQVVGYVFVVVALQQLVQHFALALAQAGQCGFEAAGLSVALVALAGGGQGLLHAVHQLVVLEGFFQKVPGTVLDGIDGHAHIAVAGEKQHGPGAVQRLEVLEGAQARHGLHADVEQHHGVAPVVCLLAGMLQKLGAAGPGGGAVAARVEQPGQAVADVGVVVNDVDGGSGHGRVVVKGADQGWAGVADWAACCGAGGSDSGSHTLKQAPPSRLSRLTSMRPWWASTMERQMARPMPMPPSLVL